MAFFPDKTQVQVEMQDNVTQVDLSCDHLTTHQFGRIGVAYVRDSTPKESMTIDASVFARLQPLQTPLLGKGVLTLRAYQVPFRVISPQWNDFISNKPHMLPTGTSIIVQEMPYFELKTLVSVYTANSVVITSGTPDYTIGTTQYKFTDHGRFIYKIMSTLYGQLGFDGTVTTHISAMRILAVAKAYIDWYAPMHYVGISQAYASVNALFNKDAASAYALTSADFLNIFACLKFACYSPDYFTSAWDTPVNPGPGNVGMPVSLSLKDVTNDATYPTIVTTGVNASSPYGSAYKPSNGTPFIGGTTGSSNLGFAYSTGVVTQFTLDSLRALTSYCRRANISGNYAVDGYLARFGVLLTAEKLRRSVYLGEQKTSLQFGSIYSSANTQSSGGSALGDYAGKGIIDSDGATHNQFSFNSDEFCVDLLLYTIMPKIGYYQGLDRNVLHKEVESYFSGAFDQLGCQAISKAELYLSKNTNDVLQGQSMFDGIFGYTPRLAEYKVARDFLDGDFQCASIDQGSDAWHLYRNVESNYANAASVDVVYHSPAFVAMADQSQYSRIFQYTNNTDADNFIILFQFAITAHLHAKALYETFDWEGEGKKIILDSLTSKHN